METIFAIEAEYESALREAGLAGFDAMMRVQGGPAVGWHRRRETLPLEIAVEGSPRQFYLKRVFRVPPKHAFWPLFRGKRGRSQPYHEWRILAELKSAGIPAMGRVAFGERRKWGMPVEAFLLVEAVPMAHTLENWLVPGFPRPRLTPADRRRLAVEVGILLGRLHAAGFVWPDLHPKHVYAAPAPDTRRDQAWQFCLIDVERMTRSGRRLENGERCDLDPGVSAALAKLVKGLRPAPLTSRDVACFWAGYTGLQSVSGAEDVVRGAREKKGASSLLREVADAGLQPRLPDEYEHPRCWRLDRAGGFLVDARAKAMLEDAGIKGLADVFAYGSGEAMRKPGLQAHRDRIRMTLSGGDRALYLKRYRRPPLKEQLRRMRESRLTCSSAWREMQFTKRLGQIGVPTMRSIAFGQEMWGIWEKRSFGMTEEIQGESLERLAARAEADPAAVPDGSARREIIKQLALLTRRLHRSRLFHRDLYLCHVFLTRNRDGGIVLRLIDLARMLENPRRSDRWRIKDLAALDYSAPRPLVSRADRVRFLYYYRADPERQGSIDRRFLASIQARVRRMARHDARRAAR